MTELDHMALCTCCTKLTAAQQTIIPTLLWCPECGEQHIDEGEWETRPHKTHQCQSCGHEWRPYEVPTRGVRDEKAQQAQRDAEQRLGNLLAVMHGDGGHYVAKHGWGKATEDAMVVKYALLDRAEAAEADLRRAREALKDAVRFVDSAQWHGTASEKAGARDWFENHAAALEATRPREKALDSYNPHPGDGCSCIECTGDLWR